MKSLSLEPATIEDIFEISMSSAMSQEKQLMIFEKSDMTQILGEDRSERVRQVFCAHKTVVMQITNLPELPPFSKNDSFINELMNFRYVPKSTYEITNEILIFDDVVAIYSLEPVIKLLVVRDADYARSQKQLFTQIWKEGLPPTLGFPYKPNHSFYNSLDFYIGGKQVIIWPDADAKKAFNGMSYDALSQYLGQILDQYSEFFASATYIVGFIWSDGRDRMVDLWRFTANHVDDRSGPLSEVKVFRNQKECQDMGLASGNTLMVLGLEEKLRRQSVSTEAYLKGKGPDLPLDMLNGREFFPGEPPTRRS